MVNYKFACIWRFTHSLKASTEATMDDECERLRLITTAPVHSFVASIPDPQLISSCLNLVRNVGCCVGFKLKPAIAYSLYTTLKNDLCNVLDLDGRQVLKRIHINLDYTDGELSFVQDVAPHDGKTTIGIFGLVQIGLTGSTSVFVGGFDILLSG